jgi:site-specific DNA recombinase
MNCLTYARVSTQEQAERELSLPAQRQAMREYAERQGWTVVEEFVERGVSARTADRPRLHELLDRCKQQPRVDVVLVHKIDRLARNVHDHAILRAYFKQHQIRLASVVENVDESISGQLVENIMASIAQFYSENLATEVKKGMQQLVRNGGWPHLPPRGYKVVRDAGGKGQIVLDERVAPAIRIAFESYATGMRSITDVRDELAEHGVRAGNGRLLNGEYVRGMLKNPFYAGRVRWKDLEYPGKHESLISGTLFQRVQEVLELRHRDYDGGGRHHFWLRGVLKCENCGRRMTAERHERWVYYRCVSNTIKSRLCSAPFVPGHIAEPAVASLLRRLQVSSALREQLLRAARQRSEAKSKEARFELESLRVRKAKLEVQENRLTEAFAEGAISLSSYRTTASKVRKEVAGIETALAATRADPTLLLAKLERLLGLSETLLSLHAACPPRDQTTLLQIVFKLIVVNRSGLVRYELNSPFDALLSEQPGDSRGGGAQSARVRPLDNKRITCTIKAILEFDDTVLRSIVDTPTQPLAA